MAMADGRQNLPKESLNVRFEETIALRSGGELDGIELVYETYGELNAAKDNVILIFHALTGSQNAAGFTEGVEGIGGRWTSECQTGWWDGFVGPGRAVDTDRYLVLCVNYLGGCYGSHRALLDQSGHRAPLWIVFSPGGDGGHRRFPDPSPRPVGDRSPACGGGALGGRHALSQSGDALSGAGPECHLPGDGNRGLPAATDSELRARFWPSRATPTSRAATTTRAIPPTAPTAGLPWRRMISHKTFIGIGTLENRAREEIRQTEGQLSWYQLGRTLESYMLHQGNKFVGAVRRQHLPPDRRCLAEFQSRGGGRGRRPGGLVQALPKPALPSLHDRFRRLFLSGAAGGTGGVSQRGPSPQHADHGCIRTRGTTRSYWSRNSTPRTSPTRSESRGRDIGNAEVALFL